MLSDGERGSAFPLPSGVVGSGNGLVRGGSFSSNDLGAAGNGVAALLGAGSWSCNPDGGAAFGGSSCAGGNAGSGAPKSPCFGGSCPPYPDVATGRAEGRILLTDGAASF